MTMQAECEFIDNTLKDKSNIKEWWNKIVKNVCCQVTTIGELQFLVNSLVIWYELKYPDKNLELRETISDKIEFGVKKIKSSFTNIKGMHIFLQTEYNSLIDYCVFSKNICNKEYNKMLKEELIKHAVLKLLNSNNSMIEYRYFRAKMLLKDFYPELDINRLFEENCNNTINVLSPDRMLYLERYLSGDVGMISLDNNDRSYLSLAKQLPFNVMLNEIYYYRKNAKYFNGVNNLIDYLVEEYGINDKDIKKRIQEVTMLQKYEKHLLNKNCKEQRKMVKRMKSGNI